MGRWIDKFKSLPSKVKPYVKELAIALCCGVVPGGGVIGGALDAIEKVDRLQAQETIEKVLGVVLSRGDDLIQLLQVQAQQASESRQVLTKVYHEQQALKVLIDDMKSSIRQLPHILAFLKQDIRQLRGEVRQVAGHVVAVAQNLEEVGDKLDSGQQEILSGLQELRQRLSLKQKVRLTDSISIRSDRERQLVRLTLEKLRTLPEEVRESSVVLNQVGQLFVTSGDSIRASFCFSKAVENSEDSARQGLYAFNDFQINVQAKKFDLALKRYLEAVKLNEDECELFDGDRYRAQRILGVGASGIAFLCENQVGEKVVVKALVGDLDPGTVFSEAQILKDLDSPYIAKVMEWGYANRRGCRGPYIVSEFAGEETMAKFVAVNDVMHHSEAVPVLLKIAQGLLTAHGQGVIHRDIKPENVLFHVEMGLRQPKIIDFGLGLRAEAMKEYESSVSQTDSELSLCKEIVGTLRYAPPEQRGELEVSVGPYSDVFSFGKTANLLIFGTTDPLGRHWRMVPERLANFLEKCQEKDPKMRFQSFNEVISELTAVMNRSDVTPSAMERRLVSTEAVPREPVEGSRFVSDRLQAVSLVGAAPGSQSYQLKCIEGADRGKIWIIGTAPSYVIGRGVTANFVVMDIKCSREHCKIEMIDNKLTVTGLAATNKTRVNGTSIKAGNPYPLKLGDHIKTGYTVVEVQTAD